MKLNCDYFKLRKERKRKKQEDALVKQIMYERSWHTWFAWYPVRITLGKCVWLETVERRNKTDMHMPDYKIRTLLSSDWFMYGYVLAYHYRALSPSVQHNPDKNI